MEAAAKALGLLVLASGLTGCAGTPAPQGDPAAQGEGYVAEAPLWQVGDWWRYRFTSEVYDRDFEATLVVGEAGPDGYRVGMPADAWNVDVVLFHMPPAGEVARDLSYPVHELRFQPFEWPLRDGKTWPAQWVVVSTTFEASAAQVTTPRGEEPGFRITNRGDEAASGRIWEFTYAPSAGWFGAYSRAFAADQRLLERIELVEWGHGFEGAVRLLEDLRMVLLESRTGGVLRGMEPAPPIVDFTTPTEADSVLLACVYGGGPGAYQTEVRAPSGAGCANAGTLQPGDLVTRAPAVEVPNESGTWRATLVAGGTGSATAEVMAYQTREVALTPAG